MILEALACGMPVAAFPVAGPKYMLAKTLSAKLERSTKTYDRQRSTP